ncbi:Cell division cycle protein 23 [Nymphon striatum]|nr:Cell division cycle protein 23 [Nymphon striatum]
MASESKQPQNISMKRSPEQEISDEAKKQKLEVPTDIESELKPPRQKKKMYAVLLSYCGKGYYGMQRNLQMKLPTIEEDLLSAMLKSGFIDKDLYDHPSDMSFQRASRTDKGVSAVRQIISMKLPLGFENSIPEINSHLPEQMRIIAMKIAKNRFNAKINCDSRTYSYVLPTFAFAPPEVITEESFRITEELLKEIQSNLDIFKGSHFYHNYTSGKKIGEDSARRYIMEFKIGTPFIRNKLEWVVLSIKGQSFMLHQIRKMIAMVISIMRGFATKETLIKSRKVDQMDIPKAPGLGLILEEVHYDVMNERQKGDGIHVPLVWHEYEDQIEEMREKYIYKNIIEEEVKEKSMLNWLETIPLHTFDVRTSGQNAPKSIFKEENEKIEEEKKELKLVESSITNVTNEDTSNSSSNFPNLNMALENIPTFDLDLKTCKLDLSIAQQTCASRGLFQSSKWSLTKFLIENSDKTLGSSKSNGGPESDYFRAAELAFALEDTEAELSTSVTSDLDKKDFDRYNLSYSYFVLKEYDRAAYFAEKCISPKGRFLHFFSSYLSSEKKKVENMADPSAPSPNETCDDTLMELRTELQQAHAKEELDGFSLYLYGVILKKQNLHQQALEILSEATYKEPLHWGAWLELATLVPDRDTLNSLVIPDHWMKHFFFAHTYLELQMNEEALTLLMKLQESGFGDSTYVMAQVAIAFHNMRDVDQAVKVFQDLQKVDPYRLDNMDTFSNLLYVKEMRVELSYLAHHTCDTDKYRAETCCVIGNYYSLRAQHEKAVLYFQRALKLNPSYLSAWTLMGHEYMEMKNAYYAIQCYRRAIELNRRDYRAWYGLGQTYEILKLPYYCSYYYRQAHQLRPNDSRMLVALGEAYEKLDKLQEAKKCFWKAHSMADIEGIALIKLAKLYERLHEEEQAAAAYGDFIKSCEIQGITDGEEQGQAYRYLANYFMHRNRIDDAYKNAQKCVQFNETKEEAKALLRQIAQLRSEQESGMQIDDGSETISRFRSRTDNAGGLSPLNIVFTP